MATPYSKPFGKFLSLIEDIDHGLMTSDEIKADCIDYLDMAITDYFTSCRKDLDDRDDELEQFNPDLDRAEINLIARAMKLIWLECEIATFRNMERDIGTRDFQPSSSHMQLKALLQLQDAEERRFRRIKMNYDNKDFAGLS
jgi:hypothetical protein